MSQLPERIRDFLPAPTPASNKYSRGVLGLVTGSAQYPGAALLGVAAAQSAGIGMVRYFGPAAVSHMVLLQHPEVICAFQVGNQGSVREPDAWVLGSAVASNDAAQWSNLQAALQGVSRAVVDAESTYALDFAQLPPEHALLTPHDGEFERLMARFGVPVEETRAGLASIDGRTALARQAQAYTGQAILLKGHYTVVAAGEGEVAVGPNSPHLATAGSGDVLAGLLGVLAARNPNAGWLELAEFGVELHSTAAIRAAAIGPVSASAIAHGIWQLVSESVAE